MALEFEKKSLNPYNSNMSSQIEQIAGITNKMFGFVDKNPERIKELNNFIESCMPAILQILNNYENLKGQDLQSKNIDDSLEKIELTINDVVLAFGNQLERLFEKTALDIDIEINVLTDLLKEEGLLEEGLLEDESSEDDTAEEKPLKDERFLELLEEELEN